LKWGKVFISWTVFRYITLTLLTINLTLPFSANTYFLPRLISRTKPTLLTYYGINFDLTSRNTLGTSSTPNPLKINLDLPTLRGTKIWKQKTSAIINKYKKEVCEWADKEEKWQSEIKNHTKHFRLVSNDDLLTHPPTANNVAAFSRLLVPPPPFPLESATRKDCSTP